MIDSVSIYKRVKSKMEKENIVSYDATVLGACIIAEAIINSMSQDLYDESVVKEKKND